jgi:hypothetical protein
MISYSSFSLFLEKHLLNPLYIIPQGYLPAYSTKIENFKRNNEFHSHFHGKPLNLDFNGNCIWWHEEPLNLQDLDDLSNRIILLDPNLNPVGYSGFNPEGRDWYDCEIPGHGPIMYDVNFQLFANSEKSALKKQWIKANPPLLDWYFFFHGFAALDWFRDFEYLQNICEHSITKVFMCLNHNVNNNRSYRILLLSLLQEHNLIKYGIVSAPLLSKDVIKKEIFSHKSRLSNYGKKHIIENLYKVAEPMVVDEINYNLASAGIPNFSYSALWSVITETNFYDEKLHLTEKIFKPIAIKRPFILVASPKNLEYLKSYGFLTFDKWIDESYDLEEDPDVRLKLIAKELDKLCRLSQQELDTMYKEMQSTLEYNHHHFFNKFKEIIVNELIDNFEACTKIYNLSLSERFRLPTHLVDFNSIKNLLLK